MLFALALIAIILSWSLVVGIIKLITLCFGLSFSLAIATGIWLIVFLIKLLLNK